MAGGGPAVACGGDGVEAGWDDAGAGDPLRQPAVAKAVASAAASVRPLRGKISQDGGQRRAAQPAQRGGLDLAGALAGHSQAPPHLLEGALVVVDQAETQLDDTALAR